MAVMAPPFDLEPGPAGRRAGISCLALERFSEALDCLRQAVVTARQTPDPWAEGMSLIWLGAVHEHLGSFEAAIDLPGKAALLEKTGNKWQHAFAIQRLAEACHRHGRIGDALSHYRQAQCVPPMYQARPGPL